MADLKLSVVPKRGVQGVVIVTARNCTLDAGKGLKMVLERPGHSEPFLGPKGWQAVESVHDIDTAEQVDAGLVFELGPQIVQFMSTGGYRLRLLSVASSESSVGVLAWQRIPIYRPKKEMAGAFDKNVREGKSDSEAGKTQDGDVDPVSIDPLVEEPKPVDPPTEQPKPGKSRFVLLSLAVLLVLGIGAGAGWYFLMGDKVPQGPQDLKSQLAAFLATNPSPEMVYQKGQDYLRDGETGAAMSLFRRAGEQGVGKAYLALAAIYDPTVGTSHTELHKDGGKAYSYYVKAKPFVPQDTAEAVERLKSWADEQAAAGDEKAQQLSQMMAIGN